MIHRLPTPGRNGRFGNLAGALLLGVAAARFLSNWTTVGLAAPHDPLLLLSMRSVFWLAGAIELAVGLVCLFGRRPWLKVTLVLWLALNQLVYQAGLWWSTEHHDPSVYSASLAESFGLAPATAHGLLSAVFLCLLAGSGLAAARLWVGQSRTM